MRALAGERMLRVWEAERTSRPLERSLAMLAAASPGTSAEVLEAHSPGEHQASLLRLRSIMFGPRLDAVVACPACGERLEFELDHHTLPVSPAGRPPGEAIGVEAEGHVVTLRPLRVGDLVAAGRQGDVPAARRHLAEACVLAAERDGAAVEAAGLPEEVVAAIGAALAEADPDAELMLKLRCPACAAEWEEPLDPGEFLWRELADAAGRLVREVDTLASAYGWSEAAILRMSAARRAAYLSLLEA
jgi:hypothetical protein